MADACPHLHEPTHDAWKRLRDPLRWVCDSCRSTDGIWCCLRCGHIGCGRRAHLPALGGGHSKHHFHTSNADGSTNGVSRTDGKKKQMKPLRILRSSSQRIGKDSLDLDNATTGASVTEAFQAGHVVCIDIVSKAVHCYACDDYVLSDAEWLASLREELDSIETRRDEIVSSSYQSLRDDNIRRRDIADDDYEMVERVDPAVDSVPNVKLHTTGDTVRGRKTEESSGPLIQRGITGLTNLGNTCYMNSVIQMLSHCSGFRSFFRDFLRAAAPLRLAGQGGHRITRQTTIRLKDALHVDASPDKLALTEATHALLRVLWSGRWSYITPRYFVNAVWKHGGLFAARKQQDANEFLNFFLGRVDDELKAPHATSSVMMDLFGVDQYQEVKCDECSSVTKRTEPLLGLMLSLPDGKPLSNNESDTKKSGCEIDLLDCFKTLQTTGRFIGENQFDCDKCRGKRNASWSVSLYRRPQSLLISLRRTLWNVEKGVHKDKRCVKFPIELDCSELLDIESDRVSPDEDFEECHYSLKAVVSHSGSTPFVGHYISWCRVEDDWFLFNDSYVTHSTIETVLNAEAYILLYEMRSIPSVNKSQNGG